MNTWDFVKLINDKYFMLLIYDISTFIKIKAKKLISSIQNIL